jgi:flagellar biosynthesis protein FliQ
LATLIIAGPWMLSVLSDYFRLMLTSIPSFTQ